VKPAWVGICGSGDLNHLELLGNLLIAQADLHEYLGGPNLCPTNPHPITGEKVPLTFGHEFSGIVEEVGSAVTKYKPGDRVVVRPIIFDGTCGACKAGQINCCYKNGFVGLSGYGGGLSEHIVLDESFLYRLPDNVPLDIGGRLEQTRILLLYSD
jgi:threonine dehydrogenase-like Zn-dependent dehydrogenase